MERNRNSQTSQDIDFDTEIGGLDESPGSSSEIDDLNGNSGSREIITAPSHFVFNDEESAIFNEAMASLNSRQLKAVKLECVGFDTSTIADSIDCSTATISSWRSLAPYKKLRALVLGVINRQGLQFRLDAQKMILAPVYVELMKRVNDPDTLKNLGVRDLLEVTRAIGRECRLDTAKVGGGAEEDGNDLADLQQRRHNFSRASQQNRIEKLTQDEKIIQYPLKTGTSGD